MSAKTYVVLQSPIVENAPGILLKPDGSAVTLECVVVAVPAPDVKWYHNDEEVVPDERHIIKCKKMVGKYACSLLIKNPVQGDQGVYRVTATNDHGRQSKQSGLVLKCISNSVYPEGICDP